jgi:MFS family permease
MLVNLCVFDLFSIRWVVPTNPFRRCSPNIKSRTRPLYFGIAALVWHLGFVLGPVLGGVFAERVSWRWCFYVNLPCGGLAFVILFIFLDIETPKTPFRKGLAAIDWLGSLTIVGGTVMFLLGLEFGGVSFPWASATVICLIIFGVIVLGLFVLNEWKLARYPVIAFRLFKYRSHVAVLSVTFCHSFVFISGPYFLPLYFQSVLATTPILSGVYLLPFVLSLFFLSVSAGIFNLKTGRDLESIHFGLIMMTLGFGLFIDLKPYASWGRIIPFQIIAGIGLGPNFKSPLIALETLVKPQDIATARITLSFIRQLSTSISIVLGGVIFTNGLKNRAHILRSQLPAEVAARIASTSTAPDVVYLRTLPPTQKQVVDSVLTDCLRDMWIFYVCVSALGLFASLFIDRQMLVKHHEKAKTGLDEEKEKEKKGKKEEKEEKEKKEEQEEKEEGEEEEKEQEEGEEAGVAVVTPTLAPEVEKSRDGTS